MILGFDEAGQGDVLLLVHGFPVDRRLWARQLEGLSDIRRVVTPDLRGRGKSPSPAETWTLEDHADDLADTVKYLGVDQVDLGGVSMGGYISFTFVRKYPEMVRSLTLVSTRATPDPPEYKHGRSMTAERARKFGTGALAGGMVDQLLTPHAPEEVRQSVIEMFESIPGESSANDSLAMRDREDATSVAGETKVPVLVMFGEEEALLPQGTAEALRDAIPGAELAMVPGAGHFNPLENPEGFNDAVRRFLTRA